MKILFLDQTGMLGGAEFALLDVAKPYRDSCLIGLFSDGPFRELLEQQQLPVQVLATKPIEVYRDSSFVQTLGSMKQLVPLIAQVAQKALDYDLIYANTQKALVVGAIASWFARRPLVYHLHDILSTEYFSRANRQIAVNLANRFASIVIANSKATKAAFVAAGGRSDIVEHVYCGFDPEHYQRPQFNPETIKQQLHLEGKFVVGHFSRLSPLKGQHILLEALNKCPKDITALFVGDALFGERDYVRRLHQQVELLGLKEQVKFLGFCSDVVSLMTACDLSAHTSTAPEPFGRVIVEGMLCQRPVVAAAAGGAVELVEPGETGWLFSPGNSEQLAEIIITCYHQPDLAAKIAQQARYQASHRFHMTKINQQIAQLLYRALKDDCGR